MGKHIGVCKLCGKNTELTFEHVPPKSAFNNCKVTIADGLESLTRDDILPWESDGLKGEISQRGRGGFYLCGDCNSKTGAWYVPFYEEFVKRLHFAIKNEDIHELGGIQIYTKCIRPLAILKQILVMFCDINSICDKDKELQWFLLNKEATMKLHGYKVFIYLFKGEVEKHASMIGKIDLSTGDVDKVSEIAMYPLGMRLYWDKEESFDSIGVDITNFSQYSYDEEKNATILFPILESNSVLPEDYRTKKEIVPDFEFVEKDSDKE